MLLSLKKNEKTYIYIDEKQISTNRHMEITSAFNAVVYFYNCFTSARADHLR